MMKKQFINGTILGFLLTLSAVNYWKGTNITSAYSNFIKSSFKHGEYRDETTEDHCIADGSICVYHNICHDTDANQWYALSDLDHSPLLNDDNFTKQSPMMKVKSGCTKRFEPLSRDALPAEEDSTYETGTTYLVCCWVNHFGHVFVQMMASSIHAVVKAGFENVFRSGSMKFLIDQRTKITGNHGTLRTPFEVFKFANGNPDSVMYLDELKKRAKSQGKKNVCFERLIVGMRFTDLAYARFNNTLAGELEVDMLKPLRNHLDELYPSTEELVRIAFSKTQKKPSKEEEKEKRDELSITALTDLKKKCVVQKPSGTLYLDKVCFEQKKIEIWSHKEEERTDDDGNDDKSTPFLPAECTLTFLRRVGHSREIKNFDNVLNATKTVFHEDKWNIQSVSFDGPKLLEQYHTVRNTMLYVSVSGTGSHHAMFLPDGAASIEIRYNNALDVVNTGICHVMPKLTCLSSKSHCPYERGPKSKIADHDCKHDDVKVDLESFTTALETARRGLSKRCDAALGQTNSILSRWFKEPLN